MSVGDLFTDAQKSTHSHKSLAKRLRKLEHKCLQRGRSEDFQDEIKDCVLRLFEIAKREPAGNRTVKFLSTYFATPLKSAAAQTKAGTRQKTQRARDGADEEHEEMDGQFEEDMIEKQDEDEDNEEQNATATAVLRSLAPFLSAKDKTVRYRTLQIVSAILSSLNSVDDDLYRYLRHEAMKRLKDRVPAIRLEAVLMLGPMVETELDLAENTRLERDNSEDSYGDGDEDYDDDSAQATSLLEKLLDVLGNDTNADVRRALLLNLPVSSDTLPYLLERARDKDAATRRAFYQKLCLQRLGDFRHLSVSMREKLLRWGLRDRDEKVRKLAARMFREKWIEDCARSRRHADDNGTYGEEVDKSTKDVLAPSMPALYELLERIDVVNTGAENGIAHEAMRQFWNGRPDYVEGPTFDDEFWTSLSTDSAFVVRSWNDYCHSKSELYDLIENRMPEVTRFGFILQGKINGLTAMIERNNEKEVEEEETTEQDEEETADQEFIVEQLLHIAQALDYTDEIGRRKMFGLFRNAITLPDFPEECTRLAVEALRLTCTPDAAGEREFTSVILEAISEVHDMINLGAESNSTDGTSEDRQAEREDSFVSARSEVSHTSSSTTTTTTTNPFNPNTKPQLDETHHLLTLTIQLKCLLIAHTTLQNVSGRISTNIHLSSLLESLILPCVRSHDTPLREKGLECLSLCCLLEPTMALENKAVFLRCLKLGDEPLKILCLKSLCDFILTHCPPSSADPHPPSEETYALDISPFTRVLSPSSSSDPDELTPEVQLTATASLSKLMLCGFYGGNEDKFDDAVVLAETRGVKGWEVLAKVRVAVQSERGEGGEGEREAGKTPRRRTAVAA